jgi:hypothetical protein
LTGLLRFAAALVVRFASERAEEFAVLNATAALSGDIFAGFCAHYFLSGKSCGYQQQSSRD